MKQKSEAIDFYLIPTHDIAELVNGKEAFDIKTIDCISGTMRLTRSRGDIIGVGAFKTAQRARLNLSPLRHSGLGSQPNEEIVIKRPYGPGDDKPGARYLRLTLHDETTKLFREANILYWAKALLNMTYNYIHHCISEASKEPPFNIPTLRFVDAGLVFAYTQKLNASQSIYAAYIAEELIDVTPVGPDSENADSGFVKFIHNSSPNPYPIPSEYEYEIAEFLAFTQHVQYANTGGQVYISDYQGT